MIFGEIIYGKLREQPTSLFVPFQPLCGGRNTRFCEFDRRTMTYVQGGVFPFGMRLATCIVHIIGTFLVVRVAIMWDRSPKRAMCLLAACLFASHPVHVENLAYIVGFADSLSTVFLALALCTYKHISWSMCMCLLSCLSKESGFVSFPLVFLARFLTGHSLIPSFIATVAAPIVRYLYVGGSPVNFAYADVPYIYEPSAFVRGLSYLHVHSIYARLLVLPWNMSWDYSFDAVPVVNCISDFRLLGALSTYLAVSALGWYATASTGSMIGFAVFTCSFVPASSLFLAVGTVVGERLLYPVSFGLAVLLAQVEAPSRKFLLLLTALLPVYLVLFHGRVGVWSSKFLLYQTDALAWPRSCKTLHQYGAVLVNHPTLRDDQVVLEILNKSLSVFDDNALTDYLISQIFLESGRVADAVAVHEKIANGHGIGFTDFSRFMFLVDAGYALIANGNLSMYPVSIIEEGLEIYPYVPHAHNAAGIACMHSGRMEQAFLHLAKANEYSSHRNPVVWNNLAVWYFGVGSDGAAKECLDQAVRVGGGHHVGIMENLGRVKEGKFENLTLELFYERMT